MARYYVTGWCERYCQWKADVLNAKNKKLAKELYKQANPYLRKVTTYRLIKESNNV